MAWEIVVHRVVQAWLLSLGAKDYERAVAALSELAEGGPVLGRPFVDSVKGSVHSNMKELRPRGGHLRMLFAFDTARRAIVLVGGDKNYQWNRWYEVHVPIADVRFQEHLDGLTRFTSGGEERL